MSKRAIVLYLHVHQPWRVRQYTIFDAATAHNYFDGADRDSGQDNRAIFEKVAEKSYRPMNELLERLVATHPEFKVSFSITGTFIEQAREWAPDVLESFKRLVATGRADIVAETYYHSLAFFNSREEFERQVRMHQDAVRELFGIESTVFRNTEFAYNDTLAQWAEGFGFNGILAEGWDPVLGWRSPNYLYRPSGCSDIGLLLKNYRLSDDVAFRFSNKMWESWPLLAETFDDWTNASTTDSPLINLFMDYETFGEHQWRETGIFDFMEHFVGKWLSHPENTFLTAREAVERFEPAGEISMPDTVTWADTERDLTAWMGNTMQREAMRHVYALEDSVMRTGDIGLIGDWRRLQTSDHFYYMCTKWFSDGDVHAYFSPYDSPYDAFLYYMNAIRDLRYRLMAYQGHGVVHG